MTQWPPESVSVTLKKSGNIRSLTALAEAILSRAKKIDVFLNTNGIAPTSLEQDTLDAGSPELQEHRRALANMANEMKALACGAETNVLDIAFAVGTASLEIQYMLTKSWTDALALRVTYRYGLAKVVPLEGDASYAEISECSGLSVDLCRRFIRIAAGNHIFAEDKDTQRVRHTAASRALATKPGLCDAVGLQLDDVSPAATKLIDVWQNHCQDVADPAKSAFSLYNDSNRPVFDILAADPERGARFGRAMGDFTRDDTWDVRYLLSSFAWDALDRPGTTVVDIGGGNRYISQFIARHTSHLRFVVHDLPDVVGRAPTLLPIELKDRIEFREHDFMTPQHGTTVAKAFLLRWILHDWADRYAVQILANLTPALRKGSKVLIYEYVLEDHAVVDLTDRFGFQLDAVMATLFNAKERTAAEYEALLMQADPRFIVEAVRRPEGSTMSLVEVGWTG